MDFLSPITSIIQRIHMLCFLYPLSFISMPVEVKPRKMAIFCVSFHASSYCMSTETASALMFQNVEKYVNRCLIFNKVASICLQIYHKWIPSKVFLRFLITIQNRKCIQNLLKHLRRSVLREYLLTFNRQLFSQNSPSEIFDRILNAPLE